MPSPFIASWRMIYVKKDYSLILSVVAFALYIIGGIGAFGGIYLILIMKSRDLFGLGTAETIGYLFLCVGATLCIAGVLMLRIIRNRTNQKLLQAATNKNPQNVPE